MIDSTAMTAPASSLCLDCGAPISGNYCSNCGQETKIETPTVRQFAHEMMDQYVAVEGKLGRTLRVLVSKPGQLTLDYVHGRRQRYVRPLKLYVSVSVVFFTLLGVLPDSFSPFMNGEEARTQALQEAKKDIERDEAKEAQAKADADEGDDDAKAAQATRAAAAAAAATSLVAPRPPKPQTPKVPDPDQPKAAQPEDPPLSGDLRQQIKQQIDAKIEGKGSGKAGDKTINVDLNPGRIDADVHRQVDSALHEHGLTSGFKDKAKAFATLSPKEQQKELRAKLADDAPYAMFFLLPYFAFLLRVLYRKNKLRYGVHLLFSVHLHCFMFIVLALGFLPLPSFMRTGLELAIAVYVYFALHKVYGGTWGRTLWRMGLLYVFYIAAVGVTAVSGVMSAVLGTGSS